MLIFEQTLFWAALLLLAYTYAGYPLLMHAWARIGARSCHEGDLEPPVSILVVAHNEEACIQGKIENLLALDYPADRLQIVIASDASTDATVALARGYETAGVEVIGFTGHRGKPAVLNEVIPRLNGEIVVLMDARQRIEKSALRALVRCFSDPRTGAVSGELMLDSGPGCEAGQGVGFYWHYEKFIRLAESRVDSTVGVTGALYAIRWNLFRPIPGDTILDDVLVPMEIARQGHRVLLEPRARAYDRLAATTEAEFARKVRTIAGNFQLFFREGWLLSPWRNRLWFQTVSHKFCRLLAPPCLVIAFAANLFLIGLPFYRLSMAVQILFYAAALTGHLSNSRAARSSFVSVAHAFCLLNWATVIGFSRFVRGAQEVTWQKVRR